MSEHFDKLREDYKDFFDDLKNNPMYEPYNRSDSLDKTLYEGALYRGEIEEPDQGFFGELSDEFKLAANRGMRGIANTIGADSMVESLDKDLRVNKQWLPPSERGVLGSIGGFIGSAAGSTAVTLPGMIGGAIAGTAIGGPAGTVVGLALPFANSFLISYGDTVDRNKAAGMSGESATAMAIIESALMAGVETSLGSVPALGKVLKGKPMGGVASKVLGKLESNLGKTGAKRFLWDLGKNVLNNSIEEGTEEAIQYLIETTGQSLAETVGKGTDFTENFGRNFDPGEMGYNALAGAVGGGALGIVPGAVDAARARNVRQFRDAAREGRVFRRINDKGETVGYNIIPPVDQQQNYENSSNDNPGDIPPPAAPGAGVDSAVATSAVPQITGSSLSGIIARNDLEAAEIDRIDHAPEKTIREAAAQLNIPGLDPQSGDINALRGAVTRAALAQMRQDAARQDAMITAEKQITDTLNAMADDELLSTADQMGIARTPTTPMQDIYNTVRQNLLARTQAEIDSQLAADNSALEEDTASLPAVETSDIPTASPETVPQDNNINTASETAETSAVAPAVETAEPQAAVVPETVTDNTSSASSGTDSGSNYTSTIAPESGSTIPTAPAVGQTNAGTIPTAPQDTPSVPDLPANAVTYPEAVPQAETSSANAVGLDETSGINTGDMISDADESSIVLGENSLDFDPENIELEAIKEGVVIPRPVPAGGNMRVSAKDQAAIDEYQKKLPGQKLTGIPARQVPGENRRSILAAINKVARALGVSKVIPIASRITNRETAKAFNGAHLPGAETTIRRNLVNLTNAHDPETLFFSAMHELTHSLIEKDNAAYETLVNEILPLVVDRDEYTRRLANYADGRKITPEEIEGNPTIREEFICDTVADLMMTERFWEVLSKKDMPLAQKFLLALRELLEKITRSFHRGNISGTKRVFRKNLETVIDLAAEFVAEASGKKDLNSLIRKKPTAQVNTQVVSAENTQTTDTDTATPKENLSVPPAEGSSSVNIRTNPSPSVQAEQTTAAPLEQVPEQVGEQVDKPTLSDKMRGKGKNKAEAKTDNQSEVSEKSEKSEKIPETINANSSEKEVISFLENHYDRIDGNTKESVFSKLVDHLKESPLHLKAIPQKVKVKSKKLFNALFPFANNKDARAAYTVVKVTDKEITATDGKILVVAQNTSGVEPGAYSLKKRQIVKEEISKYPDLSIITSKKYTDSTNADSLLTDGRVDGTVDIYNKLLGDGFFGGTAPVILKLGKSSIQVDATNLKKVLDLFRSQGIENITASSSTQETKFDSGRIIINNIIRIQGGNISAYIIGLNPDRIGGGGGIAEIAFLQEKTDESGNTVLFSLIGDRGAARMENAEILLDNLRIAREMTADGEDAKTIKLATGWEKGGDGKWRMEIPDLKVKKGFVLSDGSLSKFEAPVFFDDVLSDIVESPELFSAYPELKNIRVKMTSYLKAFAAWSEQDKTIYLNTDKFYRLSEQEQKRLEKAKRQINDVNNWDEKKQKSYAMLRLETDPKKIEANAKKEIEEITQLQLDRIKESLIHEIQHAIQEIEGFAPGGSMDTDVSEKQDPVLQRHIDKANELITEKEKLEKQLKELKKSPEANEKQISSVKHRIARIEELLDTNRINAESATSPQSTYKRLAGEVEARNAVTRSKMSMDERRQSLIDETADVAEEDRIYLMENAGVSELAEPFTENQKRELLNKAKAAGLKNTPILQKILHGGTITRNGNTVRFTGKNSHQIKKHLVAEGLSPVEGFISFEDIETMLPQALATKWEPNTKRNKRGRKTTNKVYTIVKNGVKYKLVTKFNGDFLSFYSDRKSVGDVYWDNPGSASSQRSKDKIPPQNPKVNPVSSKNPENSSGGVKLSMPGDVKNDVPGENLVVVHNTTANKLRNALKLGGMPAPSLAVIDTEKSDFSDFGEITLIAEKELIDPKNKKNKVYNADVYSPRSPQIVYEYSEKDYDRAFEKIKPYETREANDRDSIDKLVYYHKNGMTDRDFAEDLKRLPAVRVWFNRTNTTDQDFDTWWETVALPELNFSQDGKIFNGYTASGRRKWIPATLENVVKLMTKKIRNGEGFNYGVGNIRSMVAKQFKSIADIKKNRESIVSEEAFKAVKKDIQNEFRELEEEMRQASVGGRYRWSFDTGSDCLLAMAEGGRENMQYLKDRFGDDKEILGKMAEFLKKLENLPTEYFEAKPQRALNLNEFRSAVIPKDTPADVKKSLEDAGVEVFTYKDETDRKAVLQKATANKGIRFSLVNDIGDTSLSPIDYRRSVDPLFDFFMEQSDNGKLNPGADHIGEDFTGSFIADEYKTYSIKRKQGKNETDASYQKYLANREQKLKNAQGITLDELAAAYARKFGGEEKEVAEKFLDMLRHLTKRELVSYRAEAKQEIREYEKAENEAAKKEWKKLKEESLSNQVKELFTAAKAVIDKRWVQINRQLYTKLYQTIFPFADSRIPDIPSKREMEIMNMVLENGSMSEAAAIAEPYYTDKNKEIKKKLDDSADETLQGFIRGKKINALSQKIKGAFTDPNAKPDITLLDYLIRTPQWIADKISKLGSSVVKSIYQATQTFIEDKARIADYLDNGTAEIFRKLSRNKAEYKKVSEYLRECDINKTGAGDVKEDADSGKFTAVTADGQTIGTFDSEDMAWQALFDAEYDSLVSKGFSEIAAESVRSWRKAMDRAYMFRLDTTITTLRQLGLIDAQSTSFIAGKEFLPGMEDELPDGNVDIFQALKEMGHQRGHYFPRIRHGKYQLIAKKAGEPTIMIGFDTKAERAIAYSNYARKGYTVENRLANNADQDMLSQVNPAALSDILNQAFSRTQDIFKNDIELREVKYTLKDGKTEPHLVIAGDFKFDSNTRQVLKNLGGKIIDGVWHFVNPDTKMKENLSEIINGQMQYNIRMTALMQSVIGRSIADMIRENSSASSKIQRRKAVGKDVVRGYEEDPLRAYSLYINGIAGGTARNIMAKKMYSAYAGMDFDREEYIADLIPDDIAPDTPEYRRARMNALAEYFKEVKRRALDSSKQPNIAKYMDKYIKDMLRNTTGMERTLGFFKGLASVWMLCKPSSAFNNLVGAMATVPSVIDDRTKCGILWASKEVGYGLGLTNKYYWYNKYGNGKKLDGTNNRIFEFIHKNGWDGAELTADMLNAGTTFSSKAWKQISEKSMIMFSHTESMNRMASIRTAAMALAKQRKIDINSLSDSEFAGLMKEAKSISDFGNGVYNKGNKLSWARGGDISSILDSLLLFRTYEINQLNMIWDMISHGNIKGVLAISASLMLAGGMKVSIIGTILLTALGAMGLGGEGDDGEDNDDKIYHALSDAGYKKLSNILQYGIFSLANINLSGTYQNSFTKLIHEGISTKQDIDVPAFFMLGDIRDALNYASSGSWGKAAESVLPAWGASISRGIRENIYGVTDRAGRKRKDIFDKYIEPDEWDLAARIAGFNPIGVSEKTNRLWSEKKIKSVFSEQRNELYSRYRYMVNHGDPDMNDLVELSRDIEEYNAKVRRSRRNLPLIDAASLANSLKDRDNKTFVENLDDKDKKRREKKIKSKIVIRNGRFEKE